MLYVRCFVCLCVFVCLLVCVLFKYCACAFRLWFMVWWCMGCVCCLISCLCVRVTTCLSDVFMIDCVLLYGLMFVIC